jgi:hypothetical protein
LFYKLRGPQRPEAAGIILTAPGEEARVDYGSGPMVRDPQSGKYPRTRLFVLTLGYSRKSMRLLAWRSSVRTWAELHEKAFRRLGAPEYGIDGIACENTISTMCSSVPRRMGTTPLSGCIATLRLFSMPMHPAYLRLSHFIDLCACFWSWLALAACAFEELVGGIIGTVQGQSPAPPFVSYWKWSKHPHTYRRLRILPLRANNPKPGRS